MKKIIPFVLYIIGMCYGSMYTVNLPDGTNTQVGKEEAELIGELIIAAYNVKTATERLEEVEDKVREDYLVYDMRGVHIRKAEVKDSEARYQRILSRLWEHCTINSHLTPVIRDLDKLFGD